MAAAAAETRPGYDEVGVDVDVLMQKLRELNDLVDAPNLMVKQGGAKSAGLSRRRGLLVEIFRDGILLGGVDGTHLGDATPKQPVEAAGRLRGWPDVSLANFVRDVIDGFFPQEWRGPFPDGVAVEAVDRTRESGPRYRAFEGEGQRLGSYVVKADSPAAAEAEAAAAAAAAEAASKLTPEEAAAAAAAAAIDSMSPTELFLAGGAQSLADMEDVQRTIAARKQQRQGPPAEPP
mmetsp:Transcript_39223/g.122721  ORF Transcript_39223/g.122721 Transcript_39223/m.122721 type:complete len:234 (-) Transcript_39223:64-765(-)